MWNAANLSASLTTNVAWRGTHALHLESEETSADRPAAIGTTHLAGLRPGGTVTFHIWYRQGRGDLRPFAQDTAGGIHWSPAAAFTFPQDNKWLAYTWQVPDVPLRAVGFQLDSTGQADLIVN